MHIITYSLFTVLCALSVNGGVVSTSPKGSNITGQLIGANTAVRGSFKWAVYIKLGGSTGTKICGGSLISNLWVLTAAHCVVPYSSFELTMGACDFNAVEPGRVVMTSTNKIPHASYVASTQVNDIALIKLPSAVTFTANIDIIRLPRTSQASLTFVDKYVTMVGWGSTTYFNAAASSVQRVLTSHKVITNTACITTYGASTVIAATMCSSGPDGQNVCGGDSGGPVSWVDSADYKHTLIGVMAFGYEGANGYCNSLKPAGHARVTSYLSWINSKTGIVIQP